MTETNPPVPPMCSICYQEPPVNAIQLGCGHIFCYLCIKGAAETTGCCALCRHEIGVEFNFQDQRIIDVAHLPTSTDGYYWFFEGYQGWWLYDAETNREIEQAYKTNEKRVEKMIVGSVYIIDLENNTQQRKDGLGRLRKICRKTLELNNIKGMAGIKGQDFDSILDMMKTNEGVI